MKVEVGKLVNASLARGTAVNHYVKQCAGGEIYVAGPYCQFAYAIQAITILRAPARCYATDTRTRHRGI